jgi:hypothetical protein
MKRLVFLLLVVVVISLCACGAKREKEMVLMPTKVIYPIENVLISRESPDTNYGHLMSFGVGQAYASTISDFRSLIKFDFSEIPDRAVIKSAIFHVASTSGDDGTATLIFDVYCVTGSWSDNTVTWNTQPSVEASPTIINLSCPTGYQWRSYELADVVAELIANSDNSILLRAHNETTSYTKKTFYGIDFGEGFMPYLEIEYELPIKIAGNEGVLSKTVQAVKRYDGASWKNVKGIKTVSAQGPFNKTVF